MFEKLLTNKYFSMALIVVILLIVMMYIERNSREGMQNVDLTPLAQELVEHPWANSKCGNYKEVNNDFDKYVNQYVINKLKNNGYKYTEFLGRTDQNYLEYMRENEKDYSKPNMAIQKHKNGNGKKNKNGNNSCEPCNC